MLHYPFLPDVASMCIRCLQTDIVLTVCMDKLIGHMIKQSTWIGNPLGIPVFLIANGMENQKQYLVHVGMICT